MIFTAREYLDTYEPHVIDLMPNPSDPLSEDTERAHEIAATLGEERNSEGRYSEAIWLLVYR